MTAKQATWLGIAISAGLVLGFAGIVVRLMVWVPGVGAPTAATAGGALDPIVLEIDISKVTARAPIAGAGDAAGTYRELLKRAGAMKDFVDTVKGTAEPEKDAALRPLLEMLERGADEALPREAVLDFEELLPVSPMTEWAVREKLFAVGVIAERAGMSLRAEGKAAEAEKAFRAGLIWGKRLFQQGAYVPYKSAGIACVTMMLAELEKSFSEKWENNPERAAVAKVLYDAALPVARRWDTKEHIVRTVNLSPGDLQNLAQHDGDRAWRLDGVMWLGIARWTVEGGGGMGGATPRGAIERGLQEMEQSSDPLVARRAREALAYTRQDVRSIPTGN